MSRSSQLAIAAAVAAVAATVPVAHADKAAADVAFAEAKRLMADGKVAEACPKFELSQQEDPQLGTLLNLADCHERLGRLATAWAEFREAMELAKNRSDEREAFARERSEKLAPRIARVVLVKRGASGKLEVRLDGRDVTALIGVEIPVDPGAHEITTTVDGGPAETKTVKVERERQQLEVRVPIEPQAQRGGEGGGSSRSGSTRKLIGLSTAGAGLVLAGVGLYFGKQSFDQYDDSRAFCDDANRCTPQGAALIEDAKSSALKANILVGVGAGALAAGVILWLTAPSGERADAVTYRPVVGPNVVGGAVDLRF